jgi:hypothetical protein
VHRSNKLHYFDALAVIGNRQFCANPLEEKEVVDLARQWLVNYPKAMRRSSRCFHPPPLVIGAPMFGAPFFSGGGATPGFRDPAALR